MVLAGWSSTGIGCCGCCGIARGLQLLRHLLIGFVQLAVFILQLGKLLGQILIFGAQPGVFRAQRGDAGIFELIQSGRATADLLL